MINCSRLGSQSLLRKEYTAFKPNAFIRSISLKPNFSKLKLKPQPAGNIVGTVNDAYKPPVADYYKGSYHWTYERFVAVGMVPLVMTPFAAGVEYPMIDALFSTLLLYHCHAGFMSCIIDYIPKRVYGVWHGFATKLLTLGSCLSLYGIYIIETEGNGLFDLIKNIFIS